MFTPNVPHQKHLPHLTNLQSAIPFSSAIAHHPQAQIGPSACWMPSADAGATSYWSQQHQQQQHQRQNNESLLIRKHRSLEAVHQLLQQDNPSCSSAPSMFPAPMTVQSSSSASYHQPPFPPYANYSTTTTTAATAAFHQQPSQYHHSHRWMPSSSIGTASGGMAERETEAMASAQQKGPMDDRIDDDGFHAAAHLYQLVSAHAILQQVDLDPRALRREFASLCDRFNYLAGTVRNFWAPELRRERQRWREQCRRTSELEQRLNHMTTETQMLNAELKNRRDEQQQQIGQPRPRDFTETSYTMHEWQTLKAKLERSELSLADRIRMLSEAERRATNAEEQKAELQRRNECLSRTVTANEAQLKLLQEDLDMLRGKLETKNQQLDTRDRERKRMETELEMSRAEGREQEHRAQESERRVAQLTHQIDQLERDIRERDMQMDRMRKRMQEPAVARAEAELQQKLDNALEDRKKLEQLVGQLRAHNDAERAQQFDKFNIDRQHLEMSIQCLKKELADRHVLISSQNEKISQLDNAIVKQQQQQQQRQLQLGEESGQDERVGQAEKQRGTGRTMRECIGDNGDEQQQQNELDMTRREMDRLLERVRELEREKRQRQQQQLQQQQTHIDGIPTTDSGREGKVLADMTTMAGGGISNGTDDDEQTDALKHRIHELEEALRESVGITSEREKALAEQKKLNQQLSDQVSQLFDAGSGAAVTQHQRQLRDALNALAEARSRLEEERLRNQQMVGTVRKEFGMALVAEKEAAIALVQNCYGADGVVPHSVRERLEQMHRQKERLRHALLASTTTTTTGGEKQSQHQDELISRTFGIGTASPSAVAVSVAGAGVAAASGTGHHQQFSQPISIQTRTIGGGGGVVHQHHPPLGISAPASLTYYGSSIAAGATTNGIQHQQQTADEFVDEDGIWA